MSFRTAIDTASSGEAVQTLRALIAEEVNRQVAAEIRRILGPDIEGMATLRTTVEELQRRHDRHAETIERLQQEVAANIEGIATILHHLQLKMEHEAVGLNFFQFQLVNKGNGNKG